MPRKFQAVNPDATLHADLPAGAAENHCADTLGFREAFGGGKNYHFCPACGGWVEGLPVHAHANTLGPLSGRCVSSYSCRRCGAELAFVGMVS